MTPRTSLNLEDSGDLLFFRIVVLGIKTSPGGEKKKKLALVQRPGSLVPLTFPISVRTTFPSLWALLLGSWVRPILSQIGFGPRAFTDAVPTAPNAFLGF